MINFMLLGLPLRSFFGTVTVPPIDVITALAYTTIE